MYAHEKFGGQVRELRHRNRIAQNELAKVSGIKASNLCKIELGCYGFAKVGTYEKHRDLLREGFKKLGIECTF